jgi:hypothetical protein
MKKGQQFEGAVIVLFFSSNVCYLGKTIYSRLVSRHFGVLMEEKFFSRRSVIKDETSGTLNLSV